MGELFQGILSHLLLQGTVIIGIIVSGWITVPPATTQIVSW